MKINRHVAALAAVGLSTTPVCEAADYYLHPVRGDDANAGITPEAPLRSLKRASKLRLLAGDRVLLAAGQKFAGQLGYELMAGNATAPIVITSYAAGSSGSPTRATIDAKGSTAGILLRNCAHIVIENLQITADAGGMNPSSLETKGMRCGILIEADEPGNYMGFKIDNVFIKNVFFEKPGFVRPANEVKSANGTQSYGWGIRFMVNSPDTVMRDVSLNGCRIENVSHTGLKFTGPHKSLQNVDVRRLVVGKTGGPGVQISGMSGGHFSGLDVNGSGSTEDSRNWGRGSGLWTWNSSDIVIEKSRFQNANGPGDSAGVHIDYHCRNVIVQYNLSANNAGGFCEILGDNHNCAYRYNVSVNDGHRVKNSNGAFQEGKIFWLSGYTGSKSPHKGPFNTYFYNNTIYVGEKQVARISVTPTSKGVLIANNIFHFKGTSKTVAGDQDSREAKLDATPDNVLFTNNLFLHAENWPKDAPIQDKSPMTGDPQFQNGGGIQVADYLPRNFRLVRDKGIKISHIPGDAIGLSGGLEMETDIFGKPIRNQPDIGAIELLEN
jgi:Right handed beta helix region